MDRNSWFKQAAIACSMGVIFASASPAVETGLTSDANQVAANNDYAESTMPPTFEEVIRPELKAKYTFTQNGDLTRASGLPTYEWMPVGVEPRAIVIGIHGLTLHGRRYRVLARTLAINSVGVITMDMRGFGSCKFDPKKQFSTAEDDKTIVNHEKSYQDIVKLISAARQKYIGQRLILIGESLGCTFAVRMAAEHKDLVDGIILSAPAVKVNPDMYLGHGTVVRGVGAVLTGQEIDLHSFIKNLVSPRPAVVNEMLDDPFILKQLPLHSLMSTDTFVAKTAEWGKSIDAHLPVLIIQGSNDGCVSAKHVTDLTNNMPSDDQTLAWKGSYGHLQLETIFMRASILNVLVNWLLDQTAERMAKLDAVQQSISGVGGKLVR